LHEGQEGFRTWWSQLTDAFDQLRFEPDGFVDAGDRVVAENHVTGLGKGSRANVEMSMYNVWTLNGGKVISLSTYADHADALAAAGLRE
jgi:ketosteroid isomerase-like protein